MRIAGFANLVEVASILFALTQDLPRSNTNMSQKFKNELRESIDKELTFTNRLLLQFNFARADPYTIGFARIACSNYQASTTGERIFNHCLTNLPVYVAPDDRLQFGWNETSIWRNAGLHSFEYEHLLLAAALGDCLPEGYAAAVLCHLGSLYEDETRVNRLYKYTHVCRYNLEELLV